MHGMVESVSTKVEQDTLVWMKFKLRFNVMFVPEYSRYAKEIELLNLTQENMTVDEYE